MSPCSIIVFATPPIAVLCFWVVYAAILWPWQARSHSPDKDKPTDAHSERIYKDFEFFMSAYLAIVGAFGYIRIEKFQGNEQLIRHAMVALGAIALGVAWLFGIFVLCHQGSKIRRWGSIEWAKIFFWQENWMCIGMLGFASLVWVAAFIW
jgi:hypothetical protein